MRGRSGTRAGCALGFAEISLQVFLRACMHAMHGRVCSLHLLTVDYSTNKRQSQTAVELERVSVIVLRTDQVPWQACVHLAYKIMSPI